MTNCQMKLPSQKERKTMDNARWIVFVIAYGNKEFREFEDLADAVEYRNSKLDDKDVIDAYIFEKTSH